MRVAIVGSRSIDNESLIFDEASVLIERYAPAIDNITIISGGAPGVDAVAERFANENGYNFICFKPYHLVNRRADYSPDYYFARNMQIVDNSDLIIVFWNGESGGAKQVIDYAGSRQKNIEVVMFPPSVQYKAL